VTVDAGRDTGSPAAGPSGLGGDAGDRIVQPEIRDSRPRLRRMVAPAVATGAVAAGLAYLAVVDPNEPGHYPLCPTRALFGLDCPGCGIMRGTHDLITGNPAGALDHNIALVVLVPLALLLWLGWLRRSWTGHAAAVTARQTRRRTAILVIGLIAMVVFGVVRNFVPYLGSGIG